MKHFIIRHATTHRKKIYALIILTCITAAAYIVYFRYFGKLPQSTIYLFSDTPIPTSTDRILVFAPHQDDEALGVGGYINSAISAGASVEVVFATDGNHMGLKTVRHNEAVKVDGTLGVAESDIIFYNYPDKGLLKNEDALSASIKNTIDAFSPNLIFTTSRFDIHTDHGELGKVVRTVAATESPEAHVYTYLVHYKEYPRPQQFKPGDYLLPPVALIGPNVTWTKFMLSQSAFDKKNEAILQYKSQLKTPFLHSLMLSFLRQNELFATEN